MVKKSAPTSLIAPAFLLAVLMVPSAIALFDSKSLLRQFATTGGLFAVQQALLTLGLSLSLACCALALYHRAAARRLLHLLAFFILLEVFYRVAYGGAVTSGVLLSVPETSGRETGELLAGHPMLTGSLTLVALLAGYALVASWNAVNRFSWKRCAQAGAVSALMILASLAIGIQQFGNLGSLTRVAFAEVETTFPFDIATAFGAVAIDLLDTRRQAATRARFKFPEAAMVNADSRRGTSEIYIVVIGETSRRTNWSLFGYPRATTPRLDAIRPDLILFDRVTSNATNTILSVPLALTRAAPDTRGIERSEKSIITLLKQTGFDTYWISNQERSGAWSNPIAQIAREADHVSFPDDIKASERTDGYDSNLLTRLNQVLSGLQSGAKAVIFLHMEGSHFGYKQRYPAGFDYFRAGRDLPRILPDRQRELVDEYDNSVYFTDYNVRGVIDRLALAGGVTGLIFFSDHGERLFDNGAADSDFGHGFPTVSRQEIDIPFFVWLSSAYREAHPSLVTQLEANAESVVQLHNLFETIADLAGVDYKNRPASLSMFSDKLQSPRELDVLNTEEQTVRLPADEALKAP